MQIVITTGPSNSIRQGIVHKQRLEIGYGSSEEEAVVADVLCGDWMPTNWSPFYNPASKRMYTTAPQYSVPFSEKHEGRLQRCSASVETLSTSCH